MNDNVVALYQKIRTDGRLIAQFESCDGPEALVQQALIISSKLGVQVERQDLEAAVADLGSLIQSAANEDELTDFELEFVSAGFPINCSGGADSMT